MLNPIFSPEAFDLLAAIARTPSAAFYLERKVDFKHHIETPLQDLMLRAGARLPELVRARMEMSRNVFSRFLKNDFGRGGAWANYWGAFYPKGSRRIADAQLAVWMDRNRLGISFYINDYGALPRERFRRNCARFRGVLPGLMRHLVENPSIMLARGGRTRLDEQGYLVPEQPMTWAEWLEDPAVGDYWAFTSLRPEDVLSMPGEELVALAASLLGDYFPLALLSMDEEPLAGIEAYLGEESGSDSRV
jgi:5-methylcytosine-specific restriction protein B